MSMKGGGRRLMEKSILIFHFDYLNPSLTNNEKVKQMAQTITKTETKEIAVTKERQRRQTDREWRLESQPLRHKQRQ